MGMQAGWRRRRRGVPQGLVQVGEELRAHRALAARGRGVHVLDPFKFVQANTSQAVIIWVGLGGLGMGLIPLMIYFALGSPYFKQRPRLGASVPEDAGV
jgi:hypothetical protein